MLSPSVSSRQVLTEVAHPRLVPLRPAGDDPPMSSDPTPTATKQKKPRSRRGKLLDEFDPSWEPLLNLARIYVDEFMWMGRLELRGGIRVEVYKHFGSRRPLMLTADGRCFQHRGEGLYREIDVREEFDWAVGRTEVWWSIPRYTKLQDGESDGLDA
jgi:hypothetical protein